MVRCEFFFKKKQGKKYHADIFFAKKILFWFARKEAGGPLCKYVFRSHAGKDTNCGKLKECRSEEGGLARMRRGGNQGRETRIDEAGLRNRGLETTALKSFPPFLP